MAETDKAWKDDVAPEEGSPFRPLYGDKIKFSGQPIALVLAEEWEIARYAASLVRIEYEEQAFVTDLTNSVITRLSSRSPTSRMAMPGKPLWRPRYVTRLNISSRPSTTTQWNCLRLPRCGRRRQAHGLRQDAGRTERPALSVQRVREEAGRGSRNVAVRRGRIRFRPPAAIPGGAGDAGGDALQRSVRLVLTRQQMYGLGHRPATIERLALGAKADGTLDFHYPRGDRRHLAIRRVLPQRHRLVRRCSTNPPTQNTYTGWRGSTFPPPATCARLALRQACTPSRARWTNSP